MVRPFQTPLAYYIKRLREPEEPVGRLMEHARALGDKLGPVLLQLPPTLRADPALLDACLRCFPPDVPIAVDVKDVRTARDVDYFKVVGRLKPGVSLDTGRADVQTVAASLATQYPAINRGWSATALASARIWG